VALRFSPGSAVLETVRRNDPNLVLQINFGALGADDFCKSISPHLLRGEGEETPDGIVPLAVK
jgi:hypothetical protein